MDLNLRTIRPFVTHTRCRACDSPLEELWNLGSQGIVGFPGPDDPDPIVAPLALMLCTSLNCRLVQLRDSVTPDRLFREYWYRSGTNESMVEALKNVVDSARRRCPVNSDHCVLDIGANDGTLLSHYQGRGNPVPIRWAVDPARNVWETLKAHCDVLVPRFFPDPEFSPNRGAFRIITAIACAYDLEDPNAFFAEIARILAPDGLFVLQVGYLGDLIQQNAFDSICHEHLEYYSLTSLVNILAAHDLHVEEVQLNRVNGGSLRCYVRHKTYAAENPMVNQHGVLRVLNSEAVSGFHQPQVYQWLRERVDRIKTQVLDAVFDAREHGKAVDAYGASTKGLTLLQYFGLDHRSIRCAVDRNPIKYGRRYGGTGIGIVGEETWRLLTEPAFAIVLPWHFRKGMVEREAAGPGVPLRQPLYFPLPQPERVVVRPSQD